MASFSLFRFFRLCLIGATAFILAIYLYATSGKVRQIVVPTEQIPVAIQSEERIPDRENLNINNLHWQTLTKDNVSFFFFNAYYDNRRNSLVRPAIRVTAMMDVVKPPQLYCKIWVSSKRYVIVNVHTYHYMWFKSWRLKRELRPFLITCPIPKKVAKLVPRYVSFITKNETHEQVTNLLEVIYNSPERSTKQLAVCVKGLDFPDDRNSTSTRLVEWLETLWLLGVDKVIFYVLQIHPNFHTVLEYYKSHGRVQMIPLTLPGSQPNEPKAQHEYLAKNRLLKRLNEVIPYNDCFYRNLYLYKYIALLDVDEVIIPLGSRTTWSEMLKNVTPTANKMCSKKGGMTTYLAENFYFMDDFLQKNHGWFEDVPRYMHMLQHVYRTANYTKGLYCKGLHNTENALTLHNHSPFEFLNNVCNVYRIPAEEAMLFHYRANCVQDMSKPKCEALRANVVQDTAMWRYKDTLIDRTTKTLIALGLLNKTSTHVGVTQPRRQH